MATRSIKCMSCAWSAAAVMATAATIAAWGMLRTDTAPDPAGRTTFLVQAQDSRVAARYVEQAGGQVTDDLQIINAVGAELSRQQAATLDAANEVRVYRNAEVSVSARRVKQNKVKDSDQATLTSADTLTTETLSEPVLEDNVGVTTKGQSAAETYFPSLIGAADLHTAGIDGRGVSVAVIDTGLYDHYGKNGFEYERVTLVDFLATEGERVWEAEDGSGHGSHISSAMLSGAQTQSGLYEGIAPGADLVSLRAFRADGSASYLDVIKAVDWVVQNRDAYGIRVLNLSFSAEPRSHYWDDPLNQAVMAAWEAGIVVVVSAGNSGPDPMTVGVPGNVPYVITVGAMSDSYTPLDPTDDVLASFSSAGPTFEGFVKPDVVAPGGHILARMPEYAYIASRHPDSMHSNEEHFTMSGTSQAAAVVSGVVALMLQQDPALTPDAVKCRLVASARPAVDGEGALAYSVFQQGFGVVNAVDALASAATDCANLGLDVAADLAGKQHFGGLANQDADGNFYLMDPDGDGSLEGDGFIWSRAFLWSKGHLWDGDYVWNQAYLWGKAYLWGQAYVWSRSYPWDEESVGINATTDTMSINHWVEHE